MVDAPNEKKKPVFATDALVRWSIVAIEYAIVASLLLVAD
jgi:hypothetical protein